MKNQVKKSHANQAYQLYYHGMMLPGFIFLILFNFVPMFGAIMAFQDYRPAKGFFGSDFVGFKHFKYLFEMPDSFELFRNTLIIALGKIVLTTIMSIAFAILLNEVKNRTLKKSVQTVVYLPHFLSWVVLALVVKNLFNLDGSVNAMLGTSLNWLGSNSLFQPLLILTDTWKEFGYGSIVYLAAITSIDSTLYEAASIDGATWWKKVWHVTLPGIRTTIVLMAVMNLGNILNAGFDQVYNLYSASVYATGDILDTYVYRVGLQGLQYSFGTAVGLLKSVIAFVLMIGANKLLRSTPTVKFSKEVRLAMKVDKLRTVIIYIIIILLGLVCLLPLLNIVAISFSSSAAVEGNMVGLIPVGFSTAAYKKILEDSQFWHSFLISVERVVLALIINFVLIVLMAYPLSKTNAQFRGRNIYANLMIFAMLFNGGMIPTFLVVKSYGLLNTVWALVLPGAVPIFNVILVMNFFAAVPKELEEAAFIDGANPFQVLTKIFIPISKPVLATVSLFSIVGSWNDFYSGLIYMSKAAYYPLMTYIQSLQINVEDLIKQGNLSAVVDSASLGNTNLNAAKIVIAVIPLLLIYPLLQRYFVSGIVVGSVKG